MPAIRAIDLALPLLVALVLANDQHRAMAADDLALLAHRFDRRSYLHDPFRMVRASRLWMPVRHPLPRREKTRAVQTTPPRGTLDGSNIARGPRPSRLPVSLSLAAAGRRCRATLALGRRQVPRGEHARTVGGDGDGEFEVRGQRAVLGEDGPAVAGHADPRTPGRGHRLDRQHHALLEQRPLAGLAEVGHLRVLMHVAPHAV